MSCSSRRYSCAVRFSADAIGELARCGATVCAKKMVNSGAAIGSLALEASATQG
jgi:hypothetical protein